jgi:ubiquinone/menaquinone biosynthesis C-methylase UbiE
VGDLEDVIRHYEHLQDQEERRITEGLGRLELLRTREIVTRHLPPPPGNVLDIGGGTGVHAAWLVEAGYQPHVIDLVPRHVRRVRETLGALGVSADVGNACSLPQRDGTFDAALLLGPLYHLTQRPDRVRALAECGRVVKRGGVIVAAGINRFAPLFDGLAKGWLFDDQFRAIVERDLGDGQHRNPTENPAWFTTAYFHRPDELEDEAAEAGLSVVGLFGVEGLAGWLESAGAELELPDHRDAILWAARATESEPSLRGLSPHMLLVCKVTM